MRNDNLTIILAGGAGTRLEPLTAERAKPSVPFGGKYRIIDFTLTNCLHSGLRQILVLTQYKSFSLQKHLRDAWSIFNPELGEYISSVPPQRRKGNHWYEGTADAVFQNLYLLKRSGAKRVLILSGDHIYRMDYADMLKFHQAKHADMIVATMVVSVEESSDFGVLSVNKDNRVQEFQEKPEKPVTLPNDSGHIIASMGIYSFSIDLLIEILESDARNACSSHDFGNDIIPQLINDYNVFAYRFESTKGRVRSGDYWRDVGTIDNYYQANMDLLKPIPPLNLYQHNWPIRTYQSQNPPLRAIPGTSGEKGVFINSLAAGGVVIEGGKVHDSIIFANVFIDDGAILRKAIIFDNVRIGAGAKLQNCIIDKRVNIPAGESIGFDMAKDTARFTVSKTGIVVIPKDYIF